MESYGPTDHMVAPIKKSYVLLASETDPTGIQDLDYIIEKKLCGKLLLGNEKMAGTLRTKEGSESLTVVFLLVDSFFFE